MKIKVNWPVKTSNEFSFARLVSVISVSLGLPLLGHEIERLCNDNHVKIVGVEYLEHCDKPVAVIFELTEEQYTFLQLKYSYGD